MAAVPTYWDYLKLHELLTLQGGLEGDEESLVPDELHFIIVHQCFELWFKLILRSLRLARDELAAPKVAETTIPYVAHHLRRASRILNLGVHQFEVMETLAPQDFLAFRDKLVPSSGFQSFQMREIEILLGLDEAKRIRYGDVDPLEHIRHLAVDSPSGALAWQRIERARSETTLLRALNDWLYRTPIQGSHPGDPGDDEAVARFVSQYLDRTDAHLDENLARLIQSLGPSHTEEVEKRFDDIRVSARAFMDAEDVVPEHREKAKRVRAAVLFIESYRRLPLLAWPRLLLDVVVDLEEHMLLWRHRHLRMVERLIGRRVGTGGSSGVDYLEKTNSYRIFRDLWAIRTVLLRADDLPPLCHPERYGFAE